MKMWLKLWSVFVFCCPSVVFAAIALDASSKGTAGVTSPVQWNHTTAGSNRVLVCGIFSSPATNIPTVTYNSVSLTQIWTAENTTLNMRSSGFILAAPATGSNQVSIALSGTVDVLQGYCSSWTGVNQSTPNRTAATNVEEGGNTAASVSVSNAQNGDVVVDTIACYTTSSTPGQTGLQEDDALVGGSLCAASQYANATGSQTMTYTIGGSGFWAIGAAALIPDGGGGGGSSARNFMLLGVGP